MSLPGMWGAIHEENAEHQENDVFTKMAWCYGCYQELVGVIWRITKKTQICNQFDYKKNSIGDGSIMGRFKDLNNRTLEDLLQQLGAVHSHLYTRSWKCQTHANTHKWGCGFADTILLKRWVEVYHPHLHPWSHLQSIGTVINPQQLHHAFYTAIHHGSPQMKPISFGFSCHFISYHPQWIIPSPPAFHRCRGAGMKRPPKTEFPKFHLSACFFLAGN